MSICSLQGFNVKICRQAYLLAHNRISRPPGISIVRGSHNSLYQMVKKRTLEARTKLQSNKFPNNQPCASQNVPNIPASSDSKSKPSFICKTPSSTPTPPTPPKPSKFTAKSSSIKQPAPPAIKSLDDKLEPKKNTKKFQCKNVDILSAKNCDSADTRSRQSSAPAGFAISSRSSLSGGGSSSSNAPSSSGGSSSAPSSRSSGEMSGKRPSPCDAPKKDPCPKKTVKSTASNVSGTCGGKGGSGDNSGRNKNMLLALLAALGAGGLILWLLSKKDEKECPPTAEGAVSTYGGAQGLNSIPAKSSELPEHVPYLLIGGGTASFSAFRAIKSNDPKAKVLMITNEYRKPYMRPPLSKEMWYSAQPGDAAKGYRFKQWSGAERSLFFEPDEFFVDPTKLLESVNGGIAVAQGFTIKKIDPSARIVTLSDGYKIGYDECLIATGCSPKNLAVFQNAPLSVKEKVMVYRTPEDFERLKNYADQKKSITIIGNGFIGSELACSLANYAKGKETKVYQVFQEKGNMSKVLPDYLSKWTTRKVEELGVCVVSNASVREVHRDESVLKLGLSNGSTLITDIVVVCVGCDPNTSIANLSGLEVDRCRGGFVVNAELEARRNLFVAGDASCFYDPLLGRRRVEHHDHSVVSGRLAGENMVGKKKAYLHQSMFWSDLGPEVGYEAIGLVDSTLPTVGVFALPSTADRKADNLTEVRDIDPIEKSESLQLKKDAPDVKCDTKDDENYGRGVIFYMKDEKIVGILMWNLFNRVGLARTIINQNRKFDDLNEVAKLFEIHS